MKKARIKEWSAHLSALLFFGVVLLILGLTGCQREEPISTITESQPTRTAKSPTVSAQPGNSEIVNEPTIQPRDISILPPSLNPATPIPPPLDDLSLSDEVLVWVLLGSDTEPPFIGKTQAVHLLFIHPRFSKASVVSIPGNLYVNIPGYTMQRLNTAYSLGGIELLRKTFAYNFGVSPSRFVLAHPGDFQWLVDDLDMIDVTVFYPKPLTCGGLRAGTMQMDGAMALCYASYQDELDEIDRLRRQQQLLRVIFRKFTHESYLVKLPLLFSSYQGWVITDLDLAELLGYIPLALRLADQERIGYYLIGWDQITVWEVSEISQAQVFLPDQDSVHQLLQEAIDYLMTPQPLTDQVKTLQAQATDAAQATATHAITNTPVPIVTITETLSPIDEAPSPAPTMTPPGYP